MTSMPRRVLFAADLNLPSPRAASHAVHLAARLKFNLVVMGVSSVLRGRPVKSGYLEDLPEEQRQWLARVAEQGRREGINPEIFLTRGLFLEEVLSFARSQPAIRFIIIGLPDQESGPYLSLNLEALGSLQKLFEGEVVIVPETGKVMRLEEYLQEHRPGREA